MRELKDSLTDDCPPRNYGIQSICILRHRCTLLLEAGHEVTYITATSKLSPHGKMKKIDVSSNFKAFPENFLNIKSIMNKESDMSANDFFFPIMDKLSLATLRHEEVLKLMNDGKQHFDVIVAEWMYNELYAGIPRVFDCPLIWFSTLEPHWLALRIIDEAPNPAYNPDSMSTNSIPYTFWQRVEELWLQFSRTFYREYWKYNDLNTIFKEMYAPIFEKRGRPTPLYEDVRYNGSLMIGNSYVVLGQATRLPQNYKSVGGFHINRTVSPLPENLKNIMDNAKDGVIYFSMGSNLKSADWPQQIKRDLLKMFGELNQTVLWKFEEALPDAPSNVHVLNWAPQQSILAHPNCELFITHCGLLSTTEAVHFGVPIIGLPVFADQFVNILRAVGKGYGRKVDLTYALVEDLKSAIHHVTSNSRYRDKAKELSHAYHDRPLPPQKEIVYWVEHVVRTNGANHLRSPALMMPWYQKLYLDLLAVVASIMATVTILVKFFITTNKHMDKTKTS
ncbi:unnamed protein product, partial [Iphiclides podalirius]